MDTSIPREIDEPDEAGPGICADIGQAPFHHRAKSALDVILPG